MTKTTTPLTGNWRDKYNTNTPGIVESIEYRCGFCGRHVASEKGWTFLTPVEVEEAKIRICPNCKRPTFLDSNSQYPSSPVGNSVGSLPLEIETLYNEARMAASANAPTAAVLALRKLLMNIAVNKSASPGLSFQEYVDYLSNEGYISRDGKKWVDHIREKGNEANHVIALMKPSDAEDLIAFAEMLLKTVYEFPSRVPKK